MYYQRSLSAIESAVLLKFPGTKPHRHGGRIGNKELPEHLLWMADEVKKWDTSSMKRALEAGRWIDWMFRAVEELELWDNAMSRELSKRDVDSGYHLPH